jgi:hypothetical protein
LLLRRRRLLPLASLGALGLLTIGAILLAVAQSPTLLFFSAPPNDSAAQARFDAIVERTISAPSYVWHVGGDDSLGEVLDYQAPNRVRDEIGSDPTQTYLIIGPTYFFRRGNIDIFEATNAGGWVRYVNPPCAYTSARQDAMRYLDQLLKATSVEGSGTSFHVTWVEDYDPFWLGQTEDSVTVQTGGGYVRAIASTFRGLLQERFGQPTFEAIHTRVLFSRIGTAPAIAAPRAPLVTRGQPLCADLVIRLSLCGG